MAKTKAGGSTQNLRDSNAQRRGVKKFGGQQVKAGNILIRQLGSKFRAGQGTQMGKDDTIFAINDGVVKFVTKKVKRFTGKLKKVTYVTVVDKK